MLPLFAPLAQMVVLRCQACHNPHHQLQAQVLRLQLTLRAPTYLSTLAAFQPRTLGYLFVTASLLQSEQSAVSLALAHQQLTHFLRAVQRLHAQAL
jgi:hypothetical protein